MNDRDRLIKVETEMEAHRLQQIEIKQELVRMQERSDQRFDKLDARFDKLDARFDKIDARFDKMGGRMDRIDDRFVEERKFNEENFAAIRLELAKTTRWLAGLTITYGTAILGIMAKMAGIY